MTMMMTTSAGVKQVTGSHTLQVKPFSMPKCRYPERLAPLLAAAECVATALPAASARKMASAVRMWNSALEWFGVEAGAVNEAVVVAIMILRCCPPVNTPVPPFAARPVAPTTAAADIDILRRAAREGLCDMSSHLPVLAHDRVLRLQRSIGGRMSRIRTSKRPFLFSSLVNCTDAARKRGTAEATRDAFALVLGLFFGLRSAELLGLHGEDVNLSDRGDSVLVTLRSVKTRRSLFSVHDPYVVAGRAPLLLEWYGAFESAIGLSDGLPVFHKWRGPRRQFASVLTTELDLPGSKWSLVPMSREWLSGLVREWAPGCVPHSLRVGCATECWAAGVPLAQIQALGRWHSSAALLYIIGTLDETAAATERLGSADLRYTADGLRSQVGTSMEVDKSWWPTALAVEERWSRAIAPAEGDGDASDSSSPSGD